LLTFEKNVEFVSLENIFEFKLQILTAALI